MILEYVNPFDLVPNSWNTNRVNRENFEKLKKSLVALDNFKPIIVRDLGTSLEILAGYHRTEAAKELGFETIPIINLGTIDDAKAKEISLVDNTRYGEDDTEMLASLLEEMDTDLLIDIMPDIPVDMPIIDESGDAIMDDKLDRDKPFDDSVKVLKFKLDIERAEEIESLLSKVAFKLDLKYADGYSDFSEALYQALILDKR